jgi:hypothetical protein
VLVVSFRYPRTTKGKEKQVKRIVVDIVIIVALVVALAVAAYVGGQRGQYEADHLSWEQVQ